MALRPPAGRRALFVVPLALAGLAVGVVGVVVERGLLRFVYDRDETFQLLADLRRSSSMMEDVDPDDLGHRAPLHLRALPASTGQARLLGATVPVYNLIVIAASLAHRRSRIGWLLTRTAFGRIMRAAADNREMAEALGVDMRARVRAGLHRSAPRSAPWAARS